MTEQHSSDYHDYVIKDGRLIRQFEEMYIHSGEIPWHQDRTSFEVFSNIDIEILKRNRYDRICDVGSGIGYFSSRLFNELSSPDGGHPSVTGIDVSSTAVQRARELFPQVDFQVADIRESPFMQDFDLVVCKEIMWYVYPELEEVIHNLNTMVKKDGWLYLSQSFPETQDFLGKEVISDPFRLRELFTRYFALDFFCIEWDSTYHGRPLVHLMLKRPG